MSNYFNDLRDEDERHREEAAEDDGEGDEGKMRVHLIVDHQGHRPSDQTEDLSER